MAYIENRIKSINTIIVNSKRCNICYSTIEPDIETSTRVVYGHNYERNIIKGFCCRVLSSYRNIEPRQVIKIKKRFSYKECIDIYYVCTKCKNELHVNSILKKDLYV